MRRAPVVLAAVPALAFAHATPALAAGSAGSPSTGAAAWTLAAAAAALVVTFVVYRVIEKRALRRRDPLMGTVPAPVASRRRTFHVSGPGRDEETTIDLPAVLGAAGDADLRVTHDGVADEQVSIGLEPMGAVIVTSLAGDGFYCGEECVRHMVLEPGMTFRVGATRVTLVERRD